MKRSSNSQYGTWQASDLQMHCNKQCVLLPKHHNHFSSIPLNCLKYSQKKNHSQKISLYRSSCCSISEDFWMKSTNSRSLSIEIIKLSRRMFVSDGWNGDKEVRCIHKSLNHLLIDNDKKYSIDEKIILSRQYIYQQMHFSLTYHNSNYSEFKCSFLDPSLNTI